MSDIIMIQAHHLTKQFPARPSSPAVTALSSLNLTVKKGTLTALIGPDGAGKTTFMRLVCGLLQSADQSLRLWIRCTAISPGRSGPYRLYATEIRPV